MTPEIRRAVQKENRKRKRREPSQQQAMANEAKDKVSATEIVKQFFAQEKISEALKSSTLTDEQKQNFQAQLINFSAEWLHLLDYANLGNQAQNNANLVFGSFEANSHMMVVEAYEKEILSNERLNVEVEALLVTGTHVPYVIKLILEHVDDHKLTVEFNPFTRTPPIVEAPNYFRLAALAIRRSLIGDFEKIEKEEHEEKSLQLPVKKTKIEFNSLLNNQKEFVIEEAKKLVLVPKIIKPADISASKSGTGFFDKLRKKKIPEQTENNTHAIKNERLLPK